jgi:hypothetical protein
MRQICSDFVDICSHYLKTYDDKSEKHHLYYLNRSTVTKCDIELYSKINIWFDDKFFIDDDVLISFKDDH